MSLLKIRKKLLNIETIYHEGGPVRDDPLLVGSIAIVVNNPYAGRYVEDLSPLVEAAIELAKGIVPELITALGGTDKIQAYGKGAIVGVNGELEHGAVWHEAGGWSMRANLPNAKSIVPTAKAVASAGTRLAIPMHHIAAAYVRSHFNSMEVGIQDAPRPDEILFALVMADGGRIHSRLGGLTKDAVSVHDGQR